MNEAVRTLKNSNAWGNGEELTFFIQVLPFPSSNAPFTHFCRENVENDVYALWWAGLAQQWAG